MSCSIKDAVFQSRFRQQRSARFPPCFPNTACEHTAVVQISVRMIPGVSGDAGEVSQVVRLPFFKA